MKRRQFLTVSLGLPGLLAALTAGCGGGSIPRVSGGSSTRGDGANPAGRGAVEGYAFVSASGGVVFLTRAAGTAAGLSPASGLRAEIVGGPNTTVGSDGLLRLQNIEPGLRTLRISEGSGRAAPTGLPLDVPLTVVPDAVLPLAGTAITRAAAVQAVRAQLGDAIGVGADVLASSTPLPGGVSISLAVEPDEAATVIGAPSWFVYVDTVPTARFGHGTFLALIDAETGAVTTQEADSWPLLNGATFYGSAVVNATSPDAVQVASRARRVPAAVAAPVALEAHRAIAASGCRAVDPDGARTHFLVIQGDSRADFGFDPPTIINFLKSAPFPPVGQMQFLKTFDETVEPRVAIVNAFNSVRDAAKSGDTFVLYVTTHGVIKTGKNAPAPETTYNIACELGQGVAKTGTLADGTTYKTDRVDIRALDFGPCKACRIILLIDTCYSGNWIPILRPQLDALEKPRDLIVFTAADQLHQAVGLIGNKDVSLNEESATVAAGGLFTQSLLVAAARAKNILVKDTVSTDILANSFALAYALTDADNQADIAANALYFAQNPQKYVRALDPDEVCGKGNQTVTVQ